MSLFRKLERRDYHAHSFLTDPSVIPSNGELMFSPVLASGQGAMRHWAVWACARVIADAVSTLPVDLMQGTGSSAIPVDPLPTVLVRPSAHLDRVDWLAQVMLSLLTSGNAYGMIASRDYYEYPTQINLLPPGAITAEIDENTGRKVFRGRNGRRLSDEQVWHRTSGLVWPGEVVGLDPITYFARTITMGLDAERYASDYYQNGAHPTAVAHTESPVDEDQAKAIKRRIKQAMSNRDVVVLGAGMELAPWQGSPNDAQLAEMIRMNASMVCAIYGVPPEKLGVSMGDGGSVTYANREQRMQDFLDDAVNPWLVRLESAMSDWFPRGKFVKFNTAGRLKSDLQARTAAYAVATGNRPWMEPSEVRALENLAPLDGIDDQPAPTTTIPPTGGDGNGNGNPQG